jgi:hypothetical protein
MKNALLTSDGPEIPIVLNNSSAFLRFVETHCNDLKTILQEEESGAVHECDES